MIHSSEIMSIEPVPIPLPRGVHSYIEQPEGRTVYFGVTSTGAFLDGGELRRRLPDETDAMIRDEMWRDLDADDPVPGATARPRLSVLSGGLSQRGPSRPA